ncbi:MAG: class I SAM-dependent methyltransferase [Alphaproteobacteria bacterium]|nr:class I SAM-dependent methyltransferase [Alphaproteobacteria bacterium]
MTSSTHQAVVAGQFGPRAAAYVSSPSHAQGADLAQMAAFVARRPGGRVLDLGCGGGHVAYHAAPHAAEVVAYDLSDEMLAAVAATAAERGLANVATRQGAVERLPFPDASFDLVLSRFSAHHWSDVPAGLSEARRVLRPGGAALFNDVVSPPSPLLDTHIQAIELLRDPSHVRDYSLAEWQAMLRGAGWRPGAVVARRLPMNFATWTARMGTPETQVRAILALQAGAPAEVARHFGFQPNGDFFLDAATIEADPA